MPAVFRKGDSWAHDKMALLSSSSSILSRSSRGSCMNLQRVSAAICSQCLHLLDQYHRLALFQNMKTYSAFSSSDFH